MGKNSLFVMILTLLLIFSGSVTAASSYSSWGYRKQITLDHTKVFEDLTDFPVLIRIDDSDLAIRAQPDGDDIIFVGSNGEKLAHEIEYYQNGLLVAWVNIPQLSSTDDTISYMYYSNPSASNQENPADVWDAHYKSVHHMDESLGTVYDSTSNDNDGVPLNDFAQGTEGKIDGANQFDGVDDRIQLPQVFTSESQFTMEGWLYSGNKQGYAVSQRDLLGKGAFLQYYPNTFQLYVNNKYLVQSATANEWHYVVATYDGAVAKLYVDGKLPVSSAASITWPSLPTYFGDRAALNRAFLGRIDELRLSDIARGDGFIKTSYNNQNDPSAFFILGAEQRWLPSLSLTISNAYPNGIDAIYNPVLAATITSSLSDTVNVVFETNISGSWQPIGSFSGPSGQYTVQTENMNIKGSRYYWRVNASNGITSKTNRFSFTAKPFALKWKYNASMETVLGPLAADVNGDGYYEVFESGRDKFVALDGKDGHLLWSYTNLGITQHAPFQIKDLNNDGTPEVVLAASGRTIALHADDGSIYWNVAAESGDKYLIVLDTDRNNYPYVYIASGDYANGINGTGRLRKLRGTDGAILKETFVWYPCYGGLSAADADHDGRFELYLTDRKGGYERPPGGLGKGMQAYYADDLSLIWTEDDVTSSSHLMAIIDVNNDNILDAVALQQISNNSGIYVVDGATGVKMPGKWANSLGLGAHSPFSIYDIDGDGNLELITSRAGQAKVWDIGRWKLDATLDYFYEPPSMADVIGDSRLEIIGAYGSVKIYDGTYQLVETIPGANAIAATIVQDIDNDGFNELLVTSDEGVIRAYDTTAIAPTPRVRTDIIGYSERRMNAGIYIPPPEEA